MKDEFIDDFIPQFEVGPRELYDHPLLWINNGICVNNAFTQMLNAGKISHELFLGQDLLDYFSHRHFLQLPPNRGMWKDPRAPHIETVELSWVESSFRSANEDRASGGIKLVINESEKYVWMINSENANDYNQELDAWKARWPD